MLSKSCRCCHLGRLNEEAVILDIPHRISSQRLAAHIIRHTWWRVDRSPPRRRPLSPRKLLLFDLLDSSSLSYFILIVPMSELYYQSSEWCSHRHRKNKRT